jgi:hypothetical protein
MLRRIRTPMAYRFRFRAVTSSELAVVLQETSACRNSEPRTGMNPSSFQMDVD